MKSGYSKWRKLDNAALAFPPATDKNDTRVFRMYCELTEEISPQILQDALDRTMKKYPLFQVVLRKGLFWFYLERRDIRAVARKKNLLAADCISRIKSATGCLKHVILRFIMHLQMEQGQGIFFRSWYRITSVILHLCLRQDPI